MSWDISLVNRYGKDIGLDTNFGFMSRVFKLCPTWHSVFREFNPSMTNDGNVIPLIDISYVLDDIKGEIKSIEDNPDGRSNDDVKKYLNKIVRLIESCDEDDLHGKGLAIW